MPSPRRKSASNSTDSAKRSARTGVQGGISTTLLIQGWNLFSGRPLSVEQTIWITAMGAAVPALVAFLMNMIEDATGHALLKGPPSPTGDVTTQKMLTTLAAEVGRLGDALEARGLVEPRIFTEQEAPPAGTFRG